MRKRRLIWLMLVLLMSTVLAPLAWGQETKTLTINGSGSTTTNDYVPVYGYYVDSNSKGQFILPSASLSEMAGSAISKMTFSSTTDNAPWDNAVFDVYLEEVNETLLSSASLTWPFGQKVYTGHLEISNYVMEITLDEPFEYNGGNLKIGIEQTSTGQYKSAAFNGVYADEKASVGGYDGSTNYQSFLPQVTFTYELAAGPRKPMNLAASNIEATYATLSWTAGSDETEWELSYSTTAGDPDNGTIKTGLTSTTCMISGLTKETTYYAYVRAKKDGEYSEWSKVCAFKPTSIKNFTVNGGTTTNKYVPVYGYYVDGTSTSQFILPAASLEEMGSGTISKLVFRSSTENASWNNALFDVYMEEVSETTLSSSSLTWPFGKKVYGGHLEISNNVMVVTLNEPFDYNGGNLKIGILETQSGTYVDAEFYGISASQAASAAGTDGNNEYRSFLPEVTFAYEASASLAKPQNLVASNQTISSATLTWGEVPEVDGYELSYSATAGKAEDGTIMTGLTSTTCNLSDLKAETTYYAYVRAKKGDEYSGWSKVCQFMTDSVITPKSLTASDMKVTSLTLSWTAGSDETEWELSYSTTAGDPANGTIQTGLTNTTVELTGLTSDVPYYAYVRAKKDGQYSQWGAVCEFKLIAPRENILINDGTTTSSYTPLYGSGANYSLSSQYIIPKETLTDIAGGRITELTFYGSKANVSWGAAKYNVYLKEVDNATFSNTTFDFSGATTVYAGSLSISGSQMKITFNAPFAYSGDKNLMVAVQTTATGTGSFVSWYGENTVPNSAVIQYYQNKYGVRSELSSFLPKTTITYIPTTEPRMPKNLAASNVTKNAATLSWNSVEGAEGYELYYTTATDAPAKETTGVSVADTVYSLKGLTTETTYYAYVRTVQGEAKSRWTLACEFHPSVLQTVAVNDGKESNYYIPFNTTYINTYINEGTFIIPQTNLSAVADKPWSQITLYPVNSTFALTNAKFEVYLKETDETSFSSTSFSYSGMTSVYAGAFTIADGKLVLQLNEPFRYSGTKNLQVAIKTTQKASNNPYMQAWYGTSAGAPANNAVTKGGQNGTQNMLQTFLPKMSVTYEVKNVATKDGFTLEMNDTDDAFVVKGYDDSAAAPVIPSTVHFEDADYPVTTIGDGALKDHTALTEITIPSSITAIGENAFAGCTNMEFVNFEGTTAPTWADGTVGGEFATAGSATTWMVVPEAALADYQNAYTAWADYMLKQKADKPSIADVTVGDFTYRCINDQLTGKATATITAYNGSATNLVIPTSVTYENTTYAVTDMGADVLTGSSVIFTYTAEDNHATLNGYYGSGDELTIPATVTSDDQTYDVNAIASGVFAGKTDVAYVTFERTTPPTWADGAIGVEFATSDVTYLIVPNATAYSKAYTGWADAIGTEKPDFSVFTFSSYNATEHTVSLTGYTGTATEVRIPKKVVKDGVVYNVTTISNAFNGNTKITKVTIPEGVTTIGMRTFNGCTGLTEITIPTTVTTIDGSTKYPSGNNAFYGCTNVTAVNFLGTVPPSWTDGTQGLDFCGYNNTKIKIYVPAAALDTYRSTYTKWRNRIYSDAEFVKDGFTFVVQEDGTLQITAYNGTATDVVVPAMVARTGKTYDVASIKDSVFFGKTNVVSVTFARQTPPTWADGAVGNEFAGRSSTWIFVTDDQLAAYKAAYPAWDATGHLIAAIMKDGLIYKVQENGTDVHVIGYNGKDCEITIPSTISNDGNTYNVTAISADAFANKSNVAYVHFEATTPLSWTDGTEGREFATADATCLIVPAEAVEAYKTAYPAWADAITSTKPDYSMFSFSYNDNEKTAKVTGYNGNDEVVKVPFKVINNGVAYTVTAIDQQALESKTFKEVILPPSIVKIGSWAFRNSTSLEKIVLPAGLQTIGREAFYHCTGLTEITIPASVTTIEQQAFEGCTGVTTVYFERTTPPSWSHYDSEFNTPANTKLYVPTDSYEAYRQAYTNWISSMLASNGQFIVDGITYVVTNDGENPTVKMYDYDHTMTVVNIPETVEYAGVTYTVTEIANVDYDHNGNTESPFAGNSTHANTTLEEVSIPKTIKKLDDKTFMFCTSLKKATVYSTEVGSYPFFNCTALKELVLPNFETLDRHILSDIGSDSITLVIPGVKELVASELGSVKNMTIIAEGVTELKKGAFSGSSNNYKNLDLRLPNCRRIEDYAFATFAKDNSTDPGYFSSLTLADTIDYIGVCAFENANMPALHMNEETLRSLTRTKTLGKGAFRNAVVPDTLTFTELEAIPDSAFYSVKNVKELNFQKAKTVGNDAFNAFNNFTTTQLMNINLPQAETLGDRVFQYLKMERLELPKATTMGNYCLADYNLKVVKMDALETCGALSENTNRLGLDSISMASLKDIPKSFLFNTKVRYANFASAESVGAGAFMYCDSLRSLPLPEAKTIGEGCFDNMKNCYIDLPKVTTSLNYKYFYSSEGLTVNAPSVKEIHEPGFATVPAIVNMSLNLEGLEVIGDNAFAGIKESNGKNEGFKELNIPNVKTIGKNAFANSYMPNLNVSLENVTEIGDSAFFMTSCPTTMIANNLNSLGRFAFWGAAFESFTSTSLTEVPEYAFSSSGSAATEIVLPEVETVGKYAFFSMNFGNLEMRSLRQVGNNAFRKMNLLDPDGWTLGRIEEIGDSAFMESNMLNLVVPKSVTSFGKNAFANSEIEVLEWFCNLDIPERAFYGNTKLKYVMVGDAGFGPKVIGKDAFAWCPDLETFNMSNTVKKIGQNFLKWDGKIKTLTIPSSVDSIGDGFLHACDGLRSVHLFNKPAELDGNDEEKTVMLSDSTLYTYKNKIESFMPSFFYNTPDSVVAYQNAKIDSINTLILNDPYYVGGALKPTKGHLDIIEYNLNEHVHDCTFFVADSLTYVDYITKKNKYGVKVWERLDSLSAYNLAGSDGWEKYFGCDPYSANSKRFFQDGGYPIFYAQAWLTPEDKPANVAASVGGRYDGLSTGDAYWRSPFEYWVKYRKRNFPSSDTEWAGYRNKYQYPLPRITITPKWTTIVVPDTTGFKEAVGKNSMVAKMVGATKIDGWNRYHMRFEMIPIDSMKPNTPYIIKPEMEYTLEGKAVLLDKDGNPVDGKSVEMCGHDGKLPADQWTRDCRVTVPVDNEPGSTVSMIGCYQTYMMRKAEFYMVTKPATTSDGKETWSMSFKKATAYGKTKVPQYKCFWRVEKDGVPIANTKESILNNAEFEMDELTGIEVTEMPTVDQMHKPVEGVYDLCGQRVGDSLKHLPAGVYIVNGKKVVINK